MHSSQTPSSDRDANEAIVLADGMVGVLHDLSNRLNKASLQASVVQMQTEGEVREAVSQIRRDIAEAAALLRPFYLVRQRQREVGHSNNLNTIVSDVIAGQFSSWKRLRFQPAAQDALISGNPRALTRLMAYFLQLAQEGTNDSASLTLQTIVAPEVVQLTLGINKSISAISLLELFDPEAEVAFPNTWLLRQAFRSVLRMLNGAIKGDEQQGVVLEWRADR
jgi:hypothetical protein